MFANWHFFPIIPFWVLFCFCLAFVFFSPFLSWPLLPPGSFRCVHSNFRNWEAPQICGVFWWQKLTLGYQAPWEIYLPDASFPILIIVYKVPCASVSCWWKSADGCKEVRCFWQEGRFHRLPIAKPGRTVDLWSTKLEHQIGSSKFQALCLISLWFTGWGCSSWSLASLIFFF